MIHHRKRTQLAYLTTLLGIGVLAVALNAFLQRQPALSPNANAVVANEAAPTQPTETKTAAAVNKTPEASKTPASTTVAPTPASDQPASLSGSEVAYPSGPKLVIPSPWVYSFSTENGVSVLNFGTQQFSESNPYNASMKTDASGYFGPETIAPSEAAGPLTNEQTVTLAGGGEATIRTYSTQIGEDILNQYVANITVNGQTYSAIFYTDTTNADHIDRFTKLVGSVTSP